MGTDTDKDGAHFEAEKQAQLKDQKDGRGEWKDSLSSDSESAVGPQGYGMW